MEYKVEDISKLNDLSYTAKSLPKSIKYLDTSNVTKNKIDDIVTFNKFENKIPSRARRIVRENDFIFSTVRPNQNHYGFIDKTLSDIVVSTGFIVVTPNEKVVNSYYLYLLITQKKVIDKLQIIAENSTSTYPSIKPSDLGKLSFEIPTIRKQLEVVNLIKAIDNKINNNLKIINNLEQISQTLFRRWFIDFEFPNEEGQPYKSSGGKMIESELGEIPEGWEVRSLNQELDLIKGLSYKGKFLDKNKNLEESFPLISLSNFQFIKGFKDEKTKYYFGEHKEHHLVHEDDIVIAATDLTQDRKMLGAPALVPDLNRKMIFSLDVFKVTDSMLPKNFLYYLLQTQRYRNIVEGSATGTTVLRISKNALLSFSFTKSYFDLESKFNDIVQPNFDKIKNLNIENKNLEQLRDTLLPKLLSGEIEIPDDLEV